MKKGFFVFLIAFLTLTSFKVLHPYHVGSLNIEYNSTSKTFELTGRFFMDDLENSINKGRSSKVFFRKKNHEDKMNEIIRYWSRSNFGFAVNEKALKLNYIGYEEDKESVRVYLESDPISSPKIIEVGVSALYNLFNDQLNIIHVSVNGKRKSHKLRCPKKYVKQEF